MTTERGTPEYGEQIRDDLESSIALDGLKNSIKTGSIIPLVHYLGRYLSQTEISEIAGVQPSSVSRWFDESTQEIRIKSGQKSIRTAVATIEYLQANFDCEEIDMGEFLRSYTIDADTHEAVSMIDLLRNDHTSAVIDRAGQIFQPKNP